MEHGGKQNENMELMYESFMVVFTECMNEAVPKKKIKLGWRRRKPLWWNEEVSEAKQEWNGAKKIV